MGNGLFSYSENCICEKNSWGVFGFVMKCFLIVNDIFECFKERYIFFMSIERNDFYNGQRIDADVLNAIFDYTDDKTQLISDSLDATNASLDATNARTAGLSGDDVLTTLLGGGGGGGILNLVTDSLQINGTDYMETGSNDNGNYIKFENGVAIAWNSRTLYNGDTETDSSSKPNFIKLRNYFPITFVSYPATSIVISRLTAVGIGTNFMTPRAPGNTWSNSWLMIFEGDSSFFTVSGQWGFIIGMIAIGFWK